eukprot:CAMPEP_0194707572 /NCGR_PEP_ID=MMETSP0296-20130528/440_1 /TAXON_ID=39354 /ORGANISM="Heterosigma akashiwo, Strain CCMP2393" /LENGTH=618 /DNA_ID=CAMNT_0039603867 /DNA_START=1050 /DNA_END=2906 /DNA_ORIENTATION=+
MDLFHIEEREEVGHGCSHYAAHSTYNYLLHLQRLQLEVVPLRPGTQTEAVPLRQSAQLEQSEDAGEINQLFARFVIQLTLSSSGTLDYEILDALLQQTKTLLKESCNDIYDLVNRLLDDLPRTLANNGDCPWIKSLYSGLAYLINSEYKRNNLMPEQLKDDPLARGFTLTLAKALEHYSDNSPAHDGPPQPNILKGEVKENSTTEEYSAAPAPYPDDPARLPNAQPLLATTQDPIPGLDPVQSPTVCAPTPAPPKPGPSTGNPARPPPLSVPQPPDPGPGPVYFLRPRSLRVPPPVPPDPGPSSNNFARSPPSRAPPPVPSDPGPSPNNSVRPPPSRAPPPVPPDPGPSPNDTDYFQRPPPVHLPPPAPPMAPSNPGIDYFQRPPPVHLPPPAPPDEGILYFFSSEEREEGGPDFTNTPPPGPPTSPEDLTQTPWQHGNTEPYYNNGISPVPLHITGLQPPLHTTGLQQPSSVPLRTTGLQQPSSVPLCTTGLQQPPPMPLAMHTTHAHTGLPPPLLGSYFDPGPSTLQQPTPTAPAHCAPALLTFSALALTSYAPALTFCALALTSCAPALTFCAYGKMNSALQRCATTAKLDHYYLNQPTQPLCATAAQNTPGLCA